VINRLVKAFVASEELRSKLTFSDVAKIRLNCDDKLRPRIELKKVGSGFSTDSDIFFETPSTTPNALQKWLGFEVIPRDGQQPAGTSLGFKVKTTGGNLYWSGSDWVSAGASDWMSADALSTNLASLPLASIGDKSIALVVNLRTTNAAVTPSVVALKLLGEFDIEFLEDIVYDGVIRTLNTQFRSSSLVVFPTSGSTDTFDLSAVLENKSYNITAVRKVVDLSDDPLKLKNLLSSYSPGPSRQDGFTNDPGTIVLTNVVPVSHLLEVTFEYVPEFIIKTGQDYFEVPAFPSVVFERIVDSDRSNFAMRDTNAYGKEFVRDTATLSAVLQFSPTQKAIRFEYAVFTNLQVDQMRLISDLAQFFSKTKTVRSFGLDEEYDVIIIDEVDTFRNKARVEAQGRLDQTDTSIATGSFDVLGVLFFHKPSIDVPLVGEGQVSVDVTLD
jgi:hypothetical protein